MRDALPDPIGTAERIVRACDRCGTCLTACPLFTSNGIERASARGKNTIIRALAAGMFVPSGDIQEAVDYCLLCRACVDACPGKVETDEAMIHIRQYLAERLSGTSIRYKIMGALLRRQLWLNGAAKILALLRLLRLNRLLPAGFVPDEYLSVMAGPALLGRKSAPSPVEFTGTQIVAYFEGCGMKLFFPSVAAKTKELLASTTSRLLTPSHLCCGLPHLAHGLKEDFLSLAQTNMALFADADIVVTDCASCGSLLKHMGTFIPGPEPERFGAKVMDVTEYLMKCGYVPRSRKGISFTYHDPCHLARGQGIKSAPRRLLAQVGELREMTGADECCGGAGSFHLDYPETAARILERKKRNIEATGADMVVTACPGCLVQLSKLSVPVVHISQLL